MTPNKPKIYPTIFKPMMKAMCKPTCESTCEPARKPAWKRAGVATAMAAYGFLASAVLASSAVVANAMMASAVVLSQLATSPVAAAQAQDFAEFKKRNQQQFSQFKQDQEKAFAEFVARWQQAEANYIQQLREHWSDAKVSNKTQWVKYSDDQRQRTTVDYETDTVTVEILDDAGGSAQDTESAVNEALRQVRELGSTKLATAVSQDPIHISAGMNFSSVRSSAHMQGQSVLPAQFTEVNKQQAQVERRADRTVVKVKLPPAAGNDRASRMLPLAKAYAAQAGLSPALVMAIIHTESSFNPLARSPIPAFGLMQIVPTSAGRDITEYLHGEQQLLSADYLYDPDQNVQAGTIYLHLLNNRYFKGVRDPESRLYLAIAAYNTGPGNVSKAIANSNKLADATRVANRMTAQQIYDRLMANLPATETKNYLRKVTSRQKHYQEEFNL
ncbi:murein transglycosylase domain-containing protein [Pseudidiomarina woesei]|uniref:Soluble lytic murein transglycosylase and related regulatory proteins (Some contain LysM/invasin domains) n=1 Tax=Pseudidiomarina woesei TaxID=1381080 RepID=A0A0K6GZA3_9GAMM|nr:murein transglycosylase domain-containing protein [Pseudidiomarina woesei]CUA83905.1 Transglycosylase SLT domain/Domain of unknown function (DUF3393) [Pseudidiomarina woesei]